MSTVRFSLRLTLLCTSMLSVTPVFAQTADAPPRDAGSGSGTAEAGRPDDIVVTGARLQAEREVDAKRQISVISDSISSDEVGTLPDFGLGEALDRVPGVSTIQNNGRGESQFLSIRGLNADYNLVEIDGVPLPANELGRRNVSLDVIPSSLAQRIEVYKSTNATMNGNAVGGTANLRTRSAFDGKGDLFVGGRFDIGKWENERVRHDSTPSGQAELVVSDTFGPDRKFGFVVSGSYFRRDSSSLNSAIDSYNYFNPTTGAKLDPLKVDISDANPAPARRRWLHYDNVRQRYGLFGKLEFNDGIFFRASLTGGYFEHRNNEERQSNILVANGNPVAASITPTSGTQNSANAQVDLVEYDQKRTIRYGDFHAELTPSDRLFLNFDLNYAQATYYQDARLATYRIANNNNLVYTYDLTPGGFTYFDMKNPDFAFNPANYKQYEYGTTLDDNKENALTAQANAGFNSHDGDRGFGIQAGGYARFLDRKYDKGVDNYRPVSGTNFLLSDVFSDVPYAPYNGRGQEILFVDPRAAEDFFSSNPNGFAPNPSSAAGSIQSDYGLTEDIYAAYAMGRFATDRLTLTAGLRYEKTDLATTSFNLQDGDFVYGQRTQHYGDWLPSAQLTYDVTRRLRVRAAFSKTIGRPNYDDLAERATITTDSDTGDVRISSGNPGLKPRRSNNYDLSFEYYLSRKTLFSVALFRKEISDEIINVRNQSDEMFDGQLVSVTRVQPVNADKETINGIELNAIVSKLDFLPAPLNGLGFSANLTLLDPTPPSVTMSDDVTRRQLSALVESANTVANVKLFYTVGPVTLQGAWNHRSPMLLTVSTSDPLNDIRYDTSDKFDAQLRVKFNRNVTVVGQIKNITNERPERKTGLDFRLLREQLDNGRAYYVGAVFKF
ncbi:TonB-dependent receptor [Sphingobium sp. AS12]|uniref:TonB-dependent receptor n=1 Tax=Sphingobium sp. AS12 TaxID=2849495 RepID=UPI001C3150D3|nr:TonB-dependent receptor [Sphingobium sp. AS12]MBV2149875.1 TonB-dependent receptor [Sphingobium sp. AS12]